MNGPWSKLSARDRRIVAIGSEGATDAVTYEAVVGESPEMVERRAAQHRDQRKSA